MKIRKPVDDKYPVSSPYGSRIDPVTKKETEFHKGIDFACPEGTDIRAICDGVIQRVGWENEADHSQGFGFRIWQIYIDENNIKHGVVYGHLSKSEVREGMEIKEGEVIAMSGNTGRSTGPHLHIGLRQWDTSQWEEIEV